jgi:hypothetical protein
MLDKRDSVWYNIISLREALFSQKKYPPQRSCYSQRGTFFARVRLVTEVVLLPDSVEPFADVVRNHACYDGYQKAYDYVKKHYSHLPSNAAEATVIISL